MHVHKAIIVSNMEEHILVKEETIWFAERVRRGYRGSEVAADQAISEAVREGWAHSTTVARAVALAREYEERLPVIK